MLRRTAERQSLPGWLKHGTGRLGASEPLQRAQEPDPLLGPWPEGRKPGENDERGLLAHPGGRERAWQRARSHAETMSTWRAKQTVASQDKPRAMADWLPRPRISFSGSRGIP